MAIKRISNAKAEQMAVAAMERMIVDLAEQLRNSREELKLEKKKLQAREDYIVGLKQDLDTHILAWQLELEERHRAEGVRDTLRRDLDETRASRDRYVKEMIDAKDVAEDLSRLAHSNNEEIKYWRSREKYYKHNH